MKVTIPKEIFLGLRLWFGWFAKDAAFIVKDSSYLTWICIRDGLIQALPYAILLTLCSFVMFSASFAGAILIKYPDDIKFNLYFK